MLTGVIPHDGDTPWTLAMERYSQRPDPPRSLNPAISVAVEKIVMRALTIGPADRFADAEELKLALEEAASLP